MAVTLADRLRPYQVAHQLVHRLERYKVSEIPGPFRRMAWSDLRYWALLLDGIVDTYGADLCEHGHPAAHIDVLPCQGLVADWPPGEQISCNTTHELHCPGPSIRTPEEWFGRVEV